MIEATLIERVLRKYGLLEGYREQEPALMWDRVVGERISRLARPIWVHEGVLFVAVPNHIVQHEFSLMREEFRRKLNSALGAERVKEIRFRVESFPKPRSVLSLEAIELSPEEEHEIEQLVAELADPTLRAAVKQLMRKAKMIEKARRKLGWKPCPQCGLLCEENFCPICGKSPSPQAPPLQAEAER